MSAESKVYTALSGSSSITLIVSTRIYPVVIPQAVAAFPTVVYSRVSGHRIYTLTGYTGVENPAIQINCMALSYDDAKNLSAQVLAVMNAATAFIAYLTDISESPIEGEKIIYQVTQEYSVWNTE